MQDLGFIVDNLSRAVDVVKVWSITGLLPLSIDPERASDIMHKISLFKRVVAKGIPMQVYSQDALLEAVLANTMGGSGFEPESMAYDPIEGMNRVLPPSLRDAWKQASYQPEAFLRSRQVVDYLTKK